MATNAKIERALNGPGVVEVTLGAALSMLLGVALAAVYLVLKPVQVVKALPKEVDPAVVYLVEGTNETAKNRQWMRKRQLLVEGQPAEIALTEDELNAWVASVLGKSPAAPKPAAATATPAAPAPASSAVIVPATPNFRIRDGVLQVGLPNTLHVFGLSLQVVMQSRGTFAQREGVFAFIPQETWVGSLPIHRIPGAEPFLFKKLLSAQEISDDVRAGWRKLTLVAVEGNTLRLTLP